MAQIALNIDMIVDIPNSAVTASVEKITDSVGTDRTNDFKQFSSANQLPISTQGEIELAVLGFVKAHEASFP